MDRSPGGPHVAVGLVSSAAATVPTRGTPTIGGAGRSGRTATCVCPTRVVARGLSSQGLRPPERPSLVSRSLYV